MYESTTPCRFGTARNKVYFGYLCNPECKQVRLPPLQMNSPAQLQASTKPEALRYPSPIAKFFLEIDGFDQGRHKLANPNLE